MPSGELNGVVQYVLDQYPRAGRRAEVISLGNAGGFSGAALWRIAGADGPLCLRCWPPHIQDASSLHHVHNLMRRARASGLAFVPQIFETASGSSVTVASARLWDLTAWMQGSANYREAPHEERLENAMVSLARLHRCWESADRGEASCPAVKRRLALAARWSELDARWWRTVLSSRGAMLAYWAERAWHLVSAHFRATVSELETWVPKRFALQPVLCDIWHDHVLFSGNQVTGVIDYGAIKKDHVSVDLARLIGSLVGDDIDRRRYALEAYEQVRPLTGEEEALLDVLDRSGVVLGLANWLLWLYRDQKPFEHLEQVAERLQQMVERVEMWPAKPGK